MEDNDDGPPLAVHYQTVDERRVVAKTADSIIVLNGIRVYAEGCVLDYTAATRLRSRSAPFTRSDLRSLLDEHPGGAAPRFSVTVPGVLLHTLGRGQAATDDNVASVDRVLWMHPLPPGENFTVAASWSAYGIGNAEHEIDGARILEAAGRVRPYWTGEKSNNP